MGESKTLTAKEVMEETTKAMWISQEKEISANHGIQQQRENIKSWAATIAGTLNQLTQSSLMTVLGAMLRVTIQIGATVISLIAAPIRSPLIPYLHQHLYVLLYAHLNVHLNLHLNEPLDKPLYAHLHLLPNLQQEESEIGFKSNSSYEIVNNSLLTIIAKLSPSLKSS